MKERDKFWMFSMLFAIYARVNPDAYVVSMVGALLCVVLMVVNWRR